ncbi:MAG: ADP-forming succinate--CoA ligase subunit beta [Candidatus Marinimicrobia bacterium]|nr:ADP-forming succinate--CoA ligase subunit beta [Candidatus Neomarinimicrobiota bacterium]|tara:strand:+ start:7206 stop:8384 length:1179 start_codon:yes stop_codon:yes gene_type:complete
MKIHEYQAKKILKKFNIPIQDGYLIENISNSREIISKVQKDFNSKAVVVKAQIHAGGRGKAGGVKFCTSIDKAEIETKEMMGKTLITHQTGSEGREVKKILVTEALDIKSEFYVAITLDRSKEMNVIMVSPEGGVDIEAVAEKNPEKIHKVWVQPNYGLRSFQIKKLINGLGFGINHVKDAIKLFQDLYKCYEETDCSLLEINPLIITEDDKIIALDAKFNFDGNALYKHSDILDMRDIDEEDPTEVEASKYNLNYIKLDGNVGCMVNGAGLAMATMDIIKLAGGEPANFLDVGGAANVDTIKNGFKIILSDKNVKAILINIFGGIVRCDRVANGVVQAVQEMDLDFPIVVRLQGTNAEQAKKILDESDVSVTSANSMKDAASKVVELALRS